MIFAVSCWLALVSGLLSCPHALAKRQRIGIAPPGRRESLFLFDNIRRDSRARRSSDLSQAVRRVGDPTRLAKMEDTIKHTPIRVNFPLRNFQTKTWHAAGGLLNKDKLQKESQANKDRRLANALGANYFDRGRFYNRRAAVEDSTFGKLSGLPDELSPEERPVYGALDLPGVDHRLSHYGEAYLLLKPHVLTHATLTSDDSHDMSFMTKEKRIPFATLENLHALFGDSNIGRVNSLASGELSGVVEVQIWRNGKDVPVRFDRDVEKIVLPKSGIAYLARTVNPLALPLVRHMAYVRLYETMHSFATRYGILFVDEQDATWTKEAFVRDIEAARGRLSKTLSYLADWSGQGTSTMGIAEIWGPAPMELEAEESTASPGTAPAVTTS